MNIYASMATIMAEINAIGKSQENKSQGFKYRGIDDVYNALNPILSKYGIFTTAKVVSQEREERITVKQTVLTFVRMHMMYTFWAQDGTSVPTEAVGEGMDGGDKATAKAMAIAHKYALLQAFLIPTADMVDPDSESHAGIKPKGEPPPIDDDPGVIPPPRRPDAISELEWRKKANDGFEELRVSVNDDTKFYEMLARFGGVKQIADFKDRNAAFETYKLMAHAVKTPPATAKPEPSPATAEQKPEPIPEQPQPTPVKQPVPVPSSHPILLVTKDSIFVKMGTNLKSGVNQFGWLFGQMKDIAGETVAHRAYVEILTNFRVKGPSDFKSLETMKDCLSKMLERAQSLATEQAKNGGLGVTNNDLPFESGAPDYNDGNLS